MSCRKKEMTMRRLRFLLFLALVALAGCSGVQKMKTIPAELHGVWRSTEPKYAGRAFEMRDRTIVITADAEARIEQVVVRVEKREDEGKTFYTIYSRTPEQEEDIWNLYLEPVDGGTIRFPTQKFVPWNRIPPEAAASTAPLAAGAPMVGLAPSPESQQ